MFKPTIGLEIHTQLNTQAKMFCASRNDPDQQQPNFNVCPICLGHPGALPRPNQKAINLVIKTGLALNCSLNLQSFFERKNYFYPDLPKGYQISQYQKPLCFEGFLVINKKKIHIRRIHIEEDTGRLVHQGNRSLVDFNRAGVPLMELVTEPDFQTGQEASDFAKELQLILRYQEVAEADMEKGELRVEANISISKNAKLGTKVELKNLNSFKAVRDAIDYEIERQNARLKKGQKIKPETRGWDSQKGVSFSQRLKESEADYRYFPEPDIPPIKLNAPYIAGLKAQLNEMPSQRRTRLQADYQLNHEITRVLVASRSLSEYFEAVASELPGIEAGLCTQENKKAVQLAANYLVAEVSKLGRFNLKKFKVSAENFAEFIGYIVKKIISSSAAQILLARMMETGADPTHLIEELKLRQISDSEQLSQIIDKTLANNQKAAADYRAGKQNALQYLLGQVMARSGGKADPQAAKQLLQAKLKAKN